MKLNAIEYRLEPDDQLCFIRIPKTGSTTLVSILDAQFPVEEICPIMMPSMHRTPPEELTKYRLFRAHCDYDIHHYLPKKPVYVTMLRHPLSRAISYYEFCKRGQRQSEFSILCREAAKIGLKEFICHPESAIRIRTSNLQTRQLAAGLGSRHNDPFVPSPLEAQFSDADLLQLAKAHLEECAFVGITEHFNDSILLLCYTFGWYPTEDYQSLRVASNKVKKEAIAQDIIEAVLEVNQLDLELYQYAEMLFQQRFTQMIQALQERYCPSNPTIDLTDRSALISTLETYYEQRYQDLNLSPLQSLDFDFLQPLSGSGWHRRNGPHSGLQGDATPFRWTGPSTESTLDFPLATDADRVIRIRISNTPATDILNSLQFQVNGLAIALTPLLRTNNSAVLEGTIPVAVLQRNRPFTRLTFTVNRTVSLRSVDPTSADDRIVGVAVQRIQLFPVSERPKPAAFQTLLFPDTDPLWTDTANWIQTHLSPGEQIAAPIHFQERFPDTWLHYTTDFAQKPAVSWVILHKERLAEVEYGALKWTTRQMRSVFANEVFVVFSNHNSLQPLSRFSVHVRPFWKHWNMIRAEQGDLPWFERIGAIAFSISKKNSNPSVS